MTFRFGQTVMTPKGKATFIGYFVDDVTVQVSRHCERDGKHICVNEIYPTGSISDIKPAHQTKPRAGTVSQVSDVATE